MKKIERGMLQRFVAGKCLDELVLKELVNKIMIRESDLSKQLMVEQEKLQKQYEENETLKGMFLHKMDEVAQLKNEICYLKEQLQEKNNIGRREQRLINVAKAVIAELEVGSIEREDLLYLGSKEVPEPNGKPSF
ncbi:putative RNase H-like nuclease (RuvC/YqgF family) [Paenibacillus polymyxa]